MKDWMGSVVSAVVVAVIALVSSREVKKANAERERAEAQHLRSQSSKTRAEETDVVIQAADRVIEKYEARDTALVARVETMEKSVRLVMTHVGALEHHMDTLEDRLRQQGIEVPPRPQRPEGWPWSLM